MANHEQWAILRKGVKTWNAWRKENPLEHPDLHLADLTKANLVGVNLADANLYMTSFTGVDLTGADFTDAHLIQADLSLANLTKADFSKANLGWANLAEANLTKAVFSGDRFSGTNFTRANLTEANFSWADLTEADFTGADLTKSYFFNAIFDRTNLTKANLSNANLYEANLSNANLTEANLYEVNLMGANLTEANLTKANLSRVNLKSTTFGATNLTGVQGLDSCQHRGPSMIDYRTLIHSGPLPVVFLRGCGLPDSLIDYLCSLTNEPLEFYSCFIIYSSFDQKFVERLYTDLQNKGVRCWFAPHNMQSGKKIYEQINQAIHEYDKLLLVLSDNSMNSEWVKTEIANARQREMIENRRILFPIRLGDFERIKNWKCFDVDTGKDSAREIREYFIPDFSTWKTDHDTYQKTIDKLLQDLKAETKKEQKNTAK